LFRKVFEWLDLESDSRFDIIQRRAQPFPRLFGDANREEVKMEHPFLMFVEPCDFGAAGQNHVPETRTAAISCGARVRELHIGGA